MIKKNITKGIKNQSWIAVQYKNYDSKITNYWIAIKDVNLARKTFLVDAFNMSKSSNDSKGVIEVDIYLDSIISAEVVPNTKYELNSNLISKIENDPEISKWLSFDLYDEAILSYIHQCIINEQEAYQSDTTLISGVDQDLINGLGKGEKLYLTYKQTSDLVPLLKKLTGIKGTYVETLTLSLNLLSIVTDKGLYVIAYKELYYNPADRSISANEEISFNYSFVTTNDKLQYKHQINKYLDIETEDFISLFCKDEKAAKVLLENEVVRFNETLDDRPYIIDLKRMYNRHIEAEIDSIKLKKHNNVLNIPLKSFFGNMTEPLKKTKERDVSVVLIDDKINIDQLRVIYNSLINPITYVQGPPGTGKTHTIINALISAFFNGDKVLVTSNNNKPISDIYSKLTSIKRRNKKIYFPFIRLGSNEEVKKSLNDLKIVLQEIKTLDVLDRTLDRYFDKSIDKVKILNTLLRHYEKAVETEEEIDILKSVVDNLDNGLRTTNISALIEIKEKDLSGYKKVSNEELIKHVNKVDEDFKTWLSFTGVKYLKKLFDDEFLELYDIINLTDEDKRLTSFNSYLKKQENFTKFQEVFPIILTTNQSVHRLGNQTENFDLVVIDEAGQSSMGHSLFALARGTRLLLVGDQNQLKPVVDLSIESNANYMKKFRVISEYNYLENSILLTMQRLDTVSKFILLRFHYRSRKAIIEFSNKKYYNSQLIIPEKKQLQDNALEFVNVDTSKIEKPAVKNTSLLEVDAIIRLLKEKKYDNVGVITPYRNQSELLKRALNDEGLSDVTVGTVHTFQGDEKETIIFSSGITSKSHEKSFDWIKNNQELINVATTRAKEKFILVSDKAEIIKRSNDKNDFFELYDYVSKKGTEVKLSNSGQTYFVNGANFKNYDTKKEAEFFKTISHLLTTADKYALKSKVRVASVLENYKNDVKKEYGLKAEFDLVIYKKFGKQLIPVVIIELDGNEHYVDEKVMRRDLLKEEICRDNNIQLIRIDNMYSRRYLYIKEILSEVLI